MAGPGAALFGDEERQEVEEVLQGGYLSRYGKDDDPRYKRKVIKLEQTVSAALRVKHTIAVNSGTSALMTALRGLGIGAGDEVLVPGYTWVASIAAVALVGATPVLTEIDDSFTLDPRDVEQKITKRTKAIMLVHILGYPGDLNRIRAIAKTHGLFVVEDCAQAMGASYDGKPLGSIGNVGAFSLNNFKTLTCGEGGLVTTNDDEVYNRAYAYHDQGFMPLRRAFKPGDPLELGMNFKMNEITAAVALGQMKKLTSIILTLREKKRLFKDAIEAAGIQGMQFERLNDPEECAVVLTVIFPDSELADRVAGALGTKTLTNTGWHNYNLMNQLLAWTDSTGVQVIRKNSLPRTDDLLTRSITLSIGVTNAGLGADFGISVTSETEEILKKAELFVSSVKPLTNGVV